MRKVFLLTIAAGLFMVPARAALAAAIAPTAEIKDSVADPKSVELSVTTSDVAFSFDVVVWTPFDAVSAQMKVQTLSGAGVFELTARAIDTAAGWDDGFGALDFTAPDLLTGNPGGKSSQDMGALAAGASVPAGTSRLMTVDAVVLAGTAAGDYRLNLADLVFGDTGAHAIDGVAGDDYVVHVVPEPVTALLLAAGAMALRRRARA